MATSSITKEFIIDDDKVCERLIKVLTEPSKRRKKTTQSSSKYEEGKKILAQLSCR